MVIVFAWKLKLKEGVQNTVITTENVMDDSHLLLVCSSYYYLLLKT